MLLAVCTLAHLNETLSPCITIKLFRFYYNRRINFTLVLISLNWLKFMFTITKKQAIKKNCFYLCFKGLFNVSTQCAPFVCLLQSISCQLHATLHFIYFHQNLVRWSPVELKFLKYISVQIGLIYHVQTCIDCTVSCSNFLMSSLTRTIWSLRKEASCFKDSTSRSTLGIFWSAWLLVSKYRNTNTVL